MQDLFDIMDYAVEHPLHVHFALAPQRQMLSPLVRPNVPKDGLPNGEPLALDRPGFRRLSLPSHLLGQGLVG